MRYIRPSRTLPLHGSTSKIILQLTLLNLNAKIFPEKSINLLTMSHFTRRMSSYHKETKPHEKHPKFGHLPLSTSGPQDCALTGSALLNTPYFNKGAGFPAEERKQFKLTGLLPQNVQTLDQQVKRAYQQYSTRKDDLAKNTFMTSLGEQNEVLYFRVSLNLLDSTSTLLYYWILSW
jgi:malate dehydrogenase (oxaloacetate-decarboxylating)